MVIEKLTIRILVVEADKEPYEKTVRNRLEKFRDIIGNDNIEVVLYEKDTLLIFDSEAIEKNLKINRMIDNDYKIRGTFILAGNNELEQDFKDMTDEQIKDYKNEFRLSKEIVQSQYMEEGADMEF